MLKLLSVYLKSKHPQVSYILLNKSDSTALLLKLLLNADY